MALLDIGAYIKTMVNVDIGRIQLTDEGIMGHISQRNGLLAQVKTTDQ